MTDEYTDIKYQRDYDPYTLQPSWLSDTISQETADIWAQGAERNEDEQERINEEEEKRRTPYVSPEAQRNIDMYNRAVAENLRRAGQAREQARQGVDRYREYIEHMRRVAQEAYANDLLRDNKLIR